MDISKQDELDLLEYLVDYQGRRSSPGANLSVLARSAVELSMYVRGLRVSYADISESTLDELALNLLTKLALYIELPEDKEQQQQADAAVSQLKQFIVLGAERYELLVALQNFEAVVRTGWAWSEDVKALTAVVAKHVVVDSDTAVDLLTASYGAQIWQGLFNGYVDKVMQQAAQFPKEEPTTLQGNKLLGDLAGVVAELLVFMVSHQEADFDENGPEARPLSRLSVP